MLTSSLICLSKVQFHMCSFPRSNCQFLEHRHFTTQERGKTIADSSRYNFHLHGFTRTKNSEVIQERSFHRFHRRRKFRLNQIYGLLLLQDHPYPNLFVARILVANVSFFSVYFYASARAAFVRMLFSSKIPFSILHFLPSLVKVAC